MTVRTASRHLRTCILFAMPACIATSVGAADPIEGAMISWHCTQEADASFHVLCVPRQVEAGSTHPVPTPTAAPTSEGVSAMADMRPVALRGDVEVFSAPAWRLPLHARPTDGQMVRQLLKSVLCGAHPACRVSYDNHRLRVAGG